MSFKCPGVEYSRQFRQDSCEYIFGLADNELRAGREEEEEEDNVLFAQHDEHFSTQKFMIFILLFEQKPYFSFVVLYCTVQDLSPFWRHSCLSLLSGNLYDLTIAAALLVCIFMTNLHSYPSTESVRVYETPIF